MTQSAFAIRHTFIDVDTGRVFRTDSDDRHGWESPQAALKAWHDRPLLNGDGYMLDFSCMSIGVLIELSFQPA